MSPNDVLTPERAEIDMICDSCQSQITEGEDFFYSQETEEFQCESCALHLDKNQSFN
jgi:hypothetical protein